MSKVTRMMIEEVDGNEVIEPTIAPIVKENLVQRDTPRAHNHNRIIFFNIMKNESKIIKRMLTHVLPHVDAVCLVDTGSTDNNVELAAEALEESGKPYQICLEPFRDFGWSRSLSIQKAQELCKTLGWDPETTYGFTIDCDMVLVVSPQFREYELKGDGHTIIQANGAIKYDNTRLMKMGHPWKCISRTHEYYGGGQTSRIPYEVIYIDDRNDGGARQDKFERDLRLLQLDIDENPKNDRAHFYMGQTLKDLGRFEEAISMFTKRIALGGWIEEVFYAHLQIGKCYDHLNKPHEMELWMNKAFEYYPKRAEPLYHLTRYFREKSQHYKAYHYYLKGKDIPYPKDDLLFVEHGVYNGLFPYEATILDCYVTGKSKQDSLADLIGYINKGFTHHIDNVWSNLPFYVEPLTSERYRGEYSRLVIKDHDEYRASSCCLIPYSNTDPLKRYVMNVRLVNYDITHTGAYIMRCPQNKVKTRNARLFLNASYQPTEERLVLKEEYERHESNIEGLEDVRLFRYQGQMRFTASCKNAAADGRIRMTLGTYHAEQGILQDVQLIEGPNRSECEKSWIFVEDTYLEKGKGKMNFIHGWNPFEIGAVEGDQLVIHTRYDTPSFFSRCRGSSPIVEYEGKLYCVTHIVRYSSPRVYSHMVLQFNKQMRLERYTIPFCFRNNKIEYCLGFHIKNETCFFVFSENDSSPGTIHVPLSNLRFTCTF
uniref:Uncharacterized protein n=1 Tax=viral metagenome TaxID=1070528 RepID=A0A6C0HKZ3_9ZZZZ